MSVTGVSSGVDFPATAGATSGASRGGQFTAAMLEALLRGSPTPIRESKSDGTDRVLYRPSDAAALSDPGRDWIGAARKSDIDADQAVKDLAAVAGPDGTLSLDDVRAYLQRFDPGAMSASDISVGWGKLTDSTMDPLTLDQVRNAVQDVLGSRATGAPSSEDPDALKNALAAFQKEARKTPVERARDEVLREHGLTEETYAALPPDQKLEIDREVVERIRLLLQAGKSKTPKEDEQLAAQSAEAAATAAAIEKQQAAYPKVIAKTTGFLTALARGQAGDASSASALDQSDIASPRGAGKI